MNIVSITALITALGSIVFGVLAYLSGRKKDSDQAVVAHLAADNNKTDVVLGGFHTLVEDLQKERDYYINLWKASEAECQETKRRLARYEGVGDDGPG